MARGLISMLKIFRSPAGCVEVPEYEKIGYQQSEPEWSDPFAVDAGTRGARDNPVAPPPPPPDAVEEEDVPPPPPVCRPFCEPEPNNYDFSICTNRHTFNIPYRVVGTLFCGGERVEPINTNEHIYGGHEVTSTEEDNGPYTSDCEARCGEDTASCGPATINIHSHSIRSIALESPFDEALLQQAGDYRFSATLSPPPRDVTTCRFTINVDGTISTRENRTGASEISAQIPSNNVSLFSEIRWGIDRCWNNFCDLHGEERTSVFVLEPGIVHYWSFNPVDGDTVRNWGNAENPGRLYGDARLTSNAAIRGKGLLLNGAMQYVSTDRTRLLNFGNVFTIAFWLKFNGRPFGDVEALVNIGEGMNNGRPQYENSLLLQSTDDRKSLTITFYQDGDTYWQYRKNLFNHAEKCVGDDEAVQTQVLNNAAWHFVTLSLGLRHPDGSVRAPILMIDGVLQNWCGYPANHNVQLADQPRLIRFGRSLNDNNPSQINGLVDEFVIYNRALNEAEVLSLCRAYRPNHCAR